MFSVHRGGGDIMMYVGDIMSTSGEYHEYIRGIPWVHRGDTMSTLGISWCMCGSNLVKTFQFLMKTLMYWTYPDVLMISLQCTHGTPQYTEHPLMYSWYPHMYHNIPDVLMMSPRMYWTSPDVLMISPTGIMISPNVLNTPWCTHEIPSDLLSTHYTGWSWKRAQVLNFCTSHLSLLTQNLNLFYLAYFHFKMS